MNKYAGVVGWIKRRLKDSFASPEAHQKKTEEVHPRMQGVQSSNIHSIGYAPDGRRLHVKFKSGGHYRYSDVGEDDHKKFRDAKSKGRHFSESIRGKFPVDHLNKVHLRDVLTRGRREFTGFRGGANLRKHIESKTGKRDYHKLTQADLRRINAGLRR